MDNGEAGIFLTLADCKALFPGLKKDEASLSGEERRVLLRIEKALYGSLSISEVEELARSTSRGMV
jgi:hypothetical protein